VRVCVYLYLYVFTRDLLVLQCRGVPLRLLYLSTNKPSVSCLSDYALGRPICCVTPTYPTTSSENKSTVRPLSHASTQCTKNRGWGHLRMVVVTALCPYKGFDCVAAYDAVTTCVVCMPDVQVWHAHQALGASMRRMHIMLSTHH